MLRSTILRAGLAVIAVAGSALAMGFHTATTANTSGHITYLDPARLSAVYGSPHDANDLVFVTQVWNRPGQAFGVYNPHPVGVWFDPYRRQWAIYNEDIAAMPQGALFFVDIQRNRGSGLAQHVASSGTISGSATIIDHPDANDNPDARIFATHVFNPGGSYSGVFETANFAVRYIAGRGRWAVFNQNGSPMRPGTGFNLWVLRNTDYRRIDPHVATSSNTVGNTTRTIYYSQPDQLMTLLMTPYYGYTSVSCPPPYYCPIGSGILNDHPVGVWFNNAANRWEIFNEDLAPMPNFAAFNFWSQEVPG